MSIGATSPNRSEPTILRVSGPDDCYFLIEPYPDGYTWRLHNDGLSAVKKVRPRIDSVQSFHESKRTFRKRESCNAQMPQIAELRSGDHSKPEIFVTFEGSSLRLGKGRGIGTLLWPGGAGGAVQVWLIHVKVVGLSREWSFRVSITWREESRRIELCEVDSDGLSDESTLVRRDGGSVLDRMSADDPNYEIARPALLKAWADSHGLVADTLAGQSSLSDYVEGCIRTFGQGAQLQVEIRDESTIQQKCKEIDRLATKFIRKFTRSASQNSKGLGKRNAKAAVSHLTRGVNEIAARSKQQLFDRELAQQSVYGPERRPHIVEGSPAPAGKAAIEPATLAPEHAKGKAIVDLLERVVDGKKTTIEGWAGTHGFGRTAAFYWKACRLNGRSLRGKVSGKKARAIEEAIRSDAVELIARTSSD